MNRMIIQCMSSDSLYTDCSELLHGHVKGDANCCFTIQPLSSRAPNCRVDKMVPCSSKVFEGHTFETLSKLGNTALNRQAPAYAGSLAGSKTSYSGSKYNVNAYVSASKRVTPSQCNTDCIKSAPPSCFIVYKYLYAQGSRSASPPYGRLNADGPSLCKDLILHCGHNIFAYTGKHAVCAHFVTSAGAANTCRDKRCLTHYQCDKKDHRIRARDHKASVKSLGAACKHTKCFATYCFASLVCSCSAKLNVCM